MSGQSGRVYIIGASRGIGAAIADRLASDGYALVLTSREPNGSVQDVFNGVAKVSPAVEHRVSQLDVTDRDMLEGMAADIAGDEDLYGLVYVAGQSYDVLAGAADYDRVLDLMRVNFMGFQRLAAAALRPMLRARAGRIVPIGSVTAGYGVQGNAIYAATKGAMLGYVRTLAVEVARKGVNVNYVAPGFVDTNLLDPYRPVLDELVKQIPASRIGQPADVADLVSYLLSPGAAYITGVTMTVDGGLSANLVQRR